MLANNQNPFKRKKRVMNYTHPLILVALASLLWPSYAEEEEGVGSPPNLMQIASLSSDVIKITKISNEQNNVELISEISGIDAIPEWGLSGAKYYFVKILNKGTGLEIGYIRAAMEGAKILRFEFVDGGWHK